MWCCDVRFALVVPRTFLAAPLPDGSAIVMPKASLPNRRTNGGTTVRMLKPVVPALFLSRRGSTRKGSISPRHVPRAQLEPTPGIAPPRVQRTMRSTPQRYVSHFMQVLKRTVVKFATPGTFEPIFASRNSWNSGQTSPRSAAATGRRSDQFRSPFGSDRRDPNTLAPNRSKARTTPLRPSRISTSS